MKKKQKQSEDCLIGSFEHLPIIEICGFPGAGKTTLIKAMLPGLVEQGLKVAVVMDDKQRVIGEKQDNNCCFYHVEADGYILNHHKVQCYRVQGDDKNSLSVDLVNLTLRYDLILIEGTGRTPTKKIWLLGKNEIEPPANVKDIQTVFSNDEGVEAVKKYLLNWLKQIWLMTPVWGCILIGGQSRRMGRPKHLLQDQNGISWLERAVKLLKPFTEKVVLSGEGQVPQALNSLKRIPDVPGVYGPLSGILSASRRHPEVSWILLACDMPGAGADSIKWLLDQRRPGLWGVVPLEPKTNRLQPLLAYYDARCGQLFERLKAAETLRIGDISKEHKVATPLIPQSIVSSWQNINTPEELEKYK